MKNIKNKMVFIWILNVFDFIFFDLFFFDLFVFQIVIIITYIV